MARGKSSVVHQVKTAINEIDRIGQSKRELKKTGQQGIHSLKQKQETLSGAQNFVKFIRKEFGVKDIYQLKEEHYRAYMSFLEREGRSVGHRQNVETALRHLQKGMNARSEKFGKENHIFVPEKRLTDWREKEKPINRSYSRAEYERILEKLPSHSRDAVMLCREMGLRIKESVNVEVQHFKLQEGRLIIENGSGITKGGRYRDVPIPTHFRAEIERMIKGKAQHEHLVPVKTDTVRRAVNKACKEVKVVQRGRGMHGFRHAYSRERLDQLFKEKEIQTKGSEMVERIMANRDVGRQADYGIFSEKDRNLYEQVKTVIDQVHSEIGHGKNRWDLVMVYMR
ncbi:tyrosine-type recombinase/integrase [Cytobacillus praedii]|uniref:tyrosine-type recombinase/integrase n=1 Tax=Cytobacillus praedii TaxID=1742358 RepID=UPI003F7EB49D